MSTGGFRGIIRSVVYPGGFMPRRKKSTSKNEPSERMGCTLPTVTVTESPSITTELEKVPSEFVRAALDHFSIVENVKTLHRYGYTAESELKMLIGFSQDTTLSATARMKATDLIHRRLLSSLERGGILRSPSSSDNDTFIEQITATPLSQTEMKSTAKRVAAAQEFLGKAQKQNWANTAPEDPVFATESEVPGSLSQEIIDVEQFGTAVDAAAGGGSTEGHKADDGGNPAGGHFVPSQPGEPDGGDAAVEGTAGPEPEIGEAPGIDSVAAGVEVGLRPESGTRGDGTIDRGAGAGPAVCHRPTKKPVAGKSDNPVTGIGGYSIGGSGADE